MADPTPEEIDKAVENKQYVQLYSGQVGYLHPASGPTPSNRVWFYDIDKGYDYDVSRNQIARISKEEIRPQTQTNQEGMIIGYEDPANRQSVLFKQPMTKEEFNAKYNPPATGKRLWPVSTAQASYVGGTGYQAEGSSDVLIPVNNSFGRPIFSSMTMTPVKQTGYLTEQQFKEAGGSDLIMQPGRGAIGSQLYKIGYMDADTNYKTYTPMATPSNEVELGNLVSQFAVMEFAGIALSKAPAAYKFMSNLGNAKVSWGMETGMKFFGSKPGGRVLTYPKPKIKFDMAGIGDSEEVFSVTYLRGMRSVEEKEAVLFRGMGSIGKGTPRFSPTSSSSTEGTEIMGIKEIFKRSRTGTEIDKISKISFPKNEAEFAEFKSEFKIDTFTKTSGTPVKIDKTITFDTETTITRFGATNSNVLGGKELRQIKYIPRDPKAFRSQEFLNPIDSGSASSGFKPAGFSNLGNSGTTTVFRQSGMVELPGWFESKNPLMGYAPAISSFRMRPVAGEQRYFYDKVYNNVGFASLGSFSKGSPFATTSGLDTGIMTKNSRIAILNSAYIPKQDFRAISIEKVGAGSGIRNRSSLFQSSKTFAALGYRQQQDLSINQRQSQPISFRMRQDSGISQRYSFSFMPREKARSPIPSFELGGSFKGMGLLKRFSMPKRSYSYRPQLASVFLGMRSLKAPKTLTGLEIRPLIGGGKKKRRRKR